MQRIVLVALGLFLVSHYNQAAESTEQRLYSALKSNDRAVFKTILKKDKVNVNHPEFDFLSDAIKTGSSTAVKLLLRKKVNLQYKHIELPSDLVRQKGLVGRAKKDPVETFSLESISTMIESHPQYASLVYYNSTLPSIVDSDSSSSEEESDSE